MRRLWLTAFSGKDNISIDIGRVVWAGMAAALCAMETHAIAWLHQAFDPVQFATACAAILASGGAALGLKGHTEPGAN